MIITSALSIQDPRERRWTSSRPPMRNIAVSTIKSPTSGVCEPVELPRRAAKALSSNQFRRQCRTDFLNYLRVREWQDIYTQLRQVVKELGLPINSEPAEYREIHTALLTGLLSHIGMKDNDKQEFTGARNARFSIFRDPVCSRNRRSGRWSPNWWKPAACGDGLPPASTRNG